MVLKPLVEIGVTKILAGMSINRINDNHQSMLMWCIDEALEIIPAAKTFIGISLPDTLGGIGVLLLENLS